MRPIKFRAWDKKTNAMYLVWDIGFKAWDGEDSVINYVRICPDGTEDRFEHEVELMQLTGLTDRHGKEIYEGELMRGRDGTLWEVFWRKEVAGFEFVGMTGATPDSWMPNIDEVASEWESVGNIYENENLL